MRGRPDGRVAGCRPGGGAGSARSAAPLTVVRAAKAVNTKAVLAYWTPARLRAAKSADVLVAGSKPHVLPPTAKAPGEPGHVAGGLPRGQAAPAGRLATVKPAAFSYPYHAGRHGLAADRRLLRAGSPGQPDLRDRPAGHDGRHPAGTTAAAATGVAAGTAMRAGPPMMLTFDRPFLLLLEDTATHTPLFLARITNPSEP